MADLREAVAFAGARSLPVFILGGGSNLLVSDAGFPGVVIRVRIKGVHAERQGDCVVLRAGAGETWDAFVAYCVAHGYWGLENLSLIPGTVGAAPVQNIGAYGREVREVIESVVVFDPLSAAERTLTNAACLFGYRDSVFKHGDAKQLIVTGVSFKLSLTPRPELAYKDLATRFSAPGAASPSLAEIRDTVIAIRTAKFPDLSRTGTAGSFWKNPVVTIATLESLRARFPEMPSYPVDATHAKIPLAWILDVVLKAKGYAKGNVALFHQQPLVLVAGRGATCREVTAFADEIETRVAEQTGIVIEKEVLVVA